MGVSKSNHSPCPRPPCSLLDIGYSIALSRLNRIRRPGPILRRSGFAGQAGRAPRGCAGAPHSGAATPSAFRLEHPPGGRTASAAEGSRPIAPRPLGTRPSRPPYVRGQSRHTVARYRSRVAPPLNLSAQQPTRNIPRNPMNVGSSLLDIGYSIALSRVKFQALAHLSAVVAPRTIGRGLILSWYRVNRCATALMPNLNDALVVSSLTLRYMIPAQAWPRCGP